MLPEARTGIGQFSGNAVWGSSAAIDTKRNQVYVATGNNYEAPQDLKDCLATAGDEADAIGNCPERVDSDENYVDAIVALDLASGAT